MSQTSSERGILLRTVTVGGGEHGYAVYVPAGVDLTGSVPAIVFLHGRGECGVDGLRQLTVGLQPAALWKDEAWGRFIIIQPQKPGYDDRWAQHEGLVLACLAAAKREWPIDAGRVYLTGLSQGGAGTWAIGANHPELFAAIAPVCGFVHSPGRGTDQGDEAERVRIAESLARARMPVWAFHGEKDSVVPADQTRRLIGQLAISGWRDDVRATFYAEADHNSWDKAYRDDGAALAKWFLTHNRQ